MSLYVVQGPPASGKTTWVRERAKQGDIVIDLDAIASALTPGQPGHRHDQPILRTAQRARAAAIDEALKHSGTTDVYVIHTLPSTQAMHRYAEHGAHVVTIDPGRDVVEQRIREQRSHSMLRVASRWYARSRVSVTQGDEDQGTVIVSRSW